jgi:ABC-type antimicrobial peptide transport system permease subunit
MFSWLDDVTRDMSHAMRTFWRSSGFTTVALLTLGLGIGANTGIRIALGAGRSRVVAMVMRQGLMLTTLGIMIGLAGALTLNSLIASLLFGVEPTDQTTIAAVIATIVVVAVIACGLPALRASRLDPNVVLRTN